MSIFSAMEDALAGACDEMHEDAVREALAFLHATQDHGTVQLSVVPGRASSPA